MAVCVFAVLLVVSEPYKYTIYGCPTEMNPWDSIINHRTFRVPGPAAHAQNVWLAEVDKIRQRLHV